MANPFVQKLSAGGMPRGQNLSGMPQHPRLPQGPQSNYAMGQAQPDQMQQQAFAQPRAQPVQMNMAGLSQQSAVPNPAPQGDLGRIKLDQMYDYTNPSLALQNALMDMGYNPMSANPFLRNMMRSASGLGQAYLQQKATGTGEVSGYGMGDDYRQFLQNNIQNGSIYGTLRQAQGQMPQLADSMRGYADQLAGGMPATALNPFMATLFDQMSSGMGQGTVNALSNLASPMMNSRMASAYQTGLGNTLVSSLRQMGPEDDVWRYLLGA